MTPVCPSNLGSVYVGVGKSHCGLRGRDEVPLRRLGPPDVREWGYEREYGCPTDPGLAEGGRDAGGKVWADGARRSNFGKGCGRPTHSTRKRHDWRLH